MTGRQLAVDCLLALSLLVVALAACGALILPAPLAKVHYLTAVTSVATPLFAAALVVQLGWGLSAGVVVVTAGLLMLSGAVLTAATGRLIGQREQLVHQESPQ